MSTQLVFCSLEIRPESVLDGAVELAVVEVSSFLMLEYWFWLIEISPLFSPTDPFVEINKEVGVTCVLDVSVE